MKAGITLSVSKNWFIAYLKKVFFKIGVTLLKKISDRKSLVIILKNSFRSKGMCIINSWFETIPVFD